MSNVVYSVTDFVAVCNQVLDTAFGSVVITGELANFKVSKNKWVYFDLKDEYSSLRFFGTVYQLQGPLEDGMMLTVRGLPQLHPKFGFSINVQNIQLSGEGTIKKVAQLLELQLQKEGLFDQGRKRTLPYPPASVGLITSAESAAFADFTKILKNRWGGIEIRLYDVQVQGEQAMAQIARAIEFFNSHADAPDVLVITRGGGSADDLQAFSSEQVTRAVAASRIPTLVAIGHEIDISLAEMAADRRASTPSNAAELLTPDREHEAVILSQAKLTLDSLVGDVVGSGRRTLSDQITELYDATERYIELQRREITFAATTLNILNPDNVLQRGYTVVYQDGRVVSTKARLRSNREFQIKFKDGTVTLQAFDE